MSWRWGCPQHPQLCLGVPTERGTQPSATIGVPTNLCGVTGFLGHHGHQHSLGSGGHQRRCHPWFAHACEVPPSPPAPICPRHHTGGHPRGETGKKTGKLRHGSPGVTTRPGNKATPPSYPQEPTDLAGRSHREKNPPQNVGGTHGKGGGGRAPLGEGAAGPRSGEGRRGGGSCGRSVPAVSGERRIIQRHQPERNQPAEPRAKIPAVK